MQIPVSELEGERLDKWVAFAQGWVVKVSPYNDYSYHYYSSDKDIPADSILVKDYRPSINGWQALELVKECGICVRPSVTVNGKVAAWAAEWVFPMKNNHKGYAGTTPEIAICRAVVAAKFGEYVEEEE